MKNLAQTLMMSVAAVALFSPAAMAADLMVASAAPAVAVPTGGNWDGAYIGATVGYGWGTADYDGTDPNPIRGAFAGGQIGYNFHLTDGVVLGVQADVNWNNEQGTYPNNPGATSRINWDGALMGRLGMDAGEFLPYIEAGVAFANETENYDGTVYGPPNFTGWTAGLGVEFKVTDNISTNVEYRYSDYGTITQTGIPDTVHLTNNTIRTGLNFHF